MLVIRLFRVGKKNQPAFKVVVTDKTRPTRAGRFLEILGFYNTLTKKRDFKADRVKYWMSVGAKPSDTVYNLLISEKIISGKKIPSHNKVEKPVVPVESAPTASVPEIQKTEVPAEQPKEEVSVVESIDATEDKEKSTEEIKKEEMPAEVNTEEQKKE